MRRAAKAAGTRVPTDLLAIGDAQVILERVREYRRAGASKFVLIPIARGDADLMDQTRRIVAEVLPEVHGWASEALPPLAQ